jgi:hypothetical protein
MHIRLTHLLLALLSALSAAVPASAQSGFPATHLSRLLARSVPDSNAAWGVAIFNLDRGNNSARFRISVSRSSSPITTYALVRAHRGGSPETLASFPAASASLTADGTLTNLPQSTIDALDSGLLSIRITTTDYPTEFVSGRIQEASNMVTFGFNVGNIVPALPDSVTGSGIMTGILDPEARRFGFTLSWEGMNAIASRIEIHRGKPGENGPVVYSSTPVDGDSILIASWNGITPEDIAAFLEGNIYAVVTTRKYTAGQIRGQLTPIELMACAIEPEQVVPPVVGSQGNGTGYFYIARSPLSGYVLYSVSAVGETEDTIESGHIHRGEFGVNGPEVAPLEGNRYGAWTYDQNQANFPLDSATHADLASGNGYLDFHTAAFPDGEVRGQLVPAATSLYRPVASTPEDPLREHGTIVARFDARTNSIRLESAGAVAGRDIEIILYTLDGARSGTFHLDAIDGAIPAGSLSTGIHMAQIIVDGRIAGASRIAIVR